MPEKPCNRGTSAAPKHAEIPSCHHIRREMMTIRMSSHTEKNDQHRQYADNAARNSDSANPWPSVDHGQFRAG
ncbi:hypothetical protein Apmu_0285_04 [Acidiphilium multivorum AIU301]|nr:hypothetical protein Apmu_0285_04 [Acidiphilium multivorum AIU301]